VLDLGFDAVPDFAGTGEPVLMTSAKGGWIGETPMQASGDAGKDRTAFGAALVTHGDDVDKALAGLICVENGFGPVAGNVYVDFPHCLDHDGIEVAGFKAGAVSLKLFPTNVVEKGLRHLAASTVAAADKKHLFQVHDAVGS